MTTTQAIAGIERMLITVPSATQIDIALTILANNGCFCINYWHESGIAEKFTELWEERNDESAPVLTPAHWVRIKMICETWESQNGVMDSSDMEDILIDYIENEYQN